MNLNILFFTIAAIIAALILITIFWNYVEREEEEIIAGDKDYVIYKLLQYSYKCYRENYGKVYRVLCKIIKINSTSPISEKDIINKVNEDIISKNNFVVEDLGSVSVVHISFDNNIIYIKVVEKLLVE
ncbi:MAG: hypothetical protein QXT38_01140 [Candidatus Aenigmatarchaeota archaeon]